MWLNKQDDVFMNEVGPDACRYMKQPCTLQQLKELDKRFINSPEDKNNE